MILIFNGSPSGKNSNCQVLSKRVSSEIGKKSSLQEITLADCKWTVKEQTQLFKKMEKATGFIFLTGTYWDSWGSPLQKFLEHVTPLEGSSAFLGKPAVVIVLNHSVGGKAVLSRLQGVLSTLGCLIPPMSGMVYSWVSQKVLRGKGKAEAAKDLWSLDDLEDILENFYRALSLKAVWKSWPVDRRDYKKVWVRK